MMLIRVSSDDQNLFATQIVEVGEDASGGGTHSERFTLGLDTRSQPTILLRGWMWSRTASQSPSLARFSGRWCGRSTGSGSPRRKETRNDEGKEDRRS